ncbi:hypothetical protein CUD01_19390 [Cellulomonas uda]|uniref:Uncharacterized protein n=1 Tax=Cellulomonas uda TaxID=1714 RepID=A0A4Y3KEM4_CELUD|nr:hypothetical protein CUD01_19390 [Cellulomonas uda]
MFDANGGTLADRPVFAAGVKAHAPTTCSRDPARSVVHIPTDHPTRQMSELGTFPACPACPPR